MTIPEFLEELKEYKGIFEMDDMGNIRVDEGYSFCPITYMADKKGKGYFEPTEFIEAADSLDINIADRRVIVNAADYCMPLDASEEEKTEKVRKDMIKILGL